MSQVDLAIQYFLSKNHFQTDSAAFKLRKASLEIKKWKLLSSQCMILLRDMNRSKESFFDQYSKLYLIFECAISHSNRESHLLWHWHSMAKDSLKKNMKRI